MDATEQAQQKARLTAAVEIGDARSVPGAHTAVRVPLGYLLFASVWIFLSDRGLEAMTSSASELGRWSSVKGWAFVGITALLLHLVLRGQQRRIEQYVGTAKSVEERYRAVFEGSPRPIILFEETTHQVLAANSAACRAYGYTEDEFTRLTMRDIRPPDDVAAYLGAVASGDIIAGRMRQRRKDGSLFLAEVAGSRIELANRVVRLSFIHDVTDRVHDEEQLKASALAFENVAEAVAVLDPEGRVVTLNRAFARLTKFEDHEIVGKPARRLLEGSPRLLAQTLRATGKMDGEVWLKRAGSKPFLVDLSVRAVNDANGAPSHYVAVARDISAEREAEARIHALAYYDTLTGLPNRNLLEDRSRQVIALHERSSQTFALLMVDLDHFKQVNDTLGHVAGDSLLQTAARQIDAAVREADTAARWGGDEFVLLLPNTDQPGAGRIAERIQKSMSAPVNVDGRLVALGVSAGIALYPRDGLDFETLLKHAGSAMQRAKDLGRNTFQFYQEPLEGAAQERVAIAGALRHALDGGQQMHVHYQPQLDLATGTVIGFEALLRWRHPELGNVAPEKFVRIAETNGYMGALGDWVLQQACLQLRALAAAGHRGTTMSVNVSVAQLHDAAFADRCIEILRWAGLPPDRLELEVTETVLLQDREARLQQLSRLRDLGVGISIDDFGTGYSSLSYLRHLPVNKIKIDRSFVQDMTSDEEAASIVQVIVSLGHTLHHIVVAEGVETGEQQRALSALGCDQAQGFYFARPMAPGMLYDWLEHRVAH